MKCRTGVGNGRKLFLENRLRSGVTLRMIQLYEQKQNDISKAQVTVVVNLAKALGCEIEDLIE